MSKRKKLQELTIKDNFMFGAVMVDEELCREFLELVLGFPIAKVTVSKEKSFIYHPEYRGIRLDVIASDENNTHYDVEMQVQRKKNLSKRGRYYHGQIDMELLTAGLDYEQLPNVYVIFICDFDPFFEKRYKYTFEMLCKENKELRLNDGIGTIFLSTCGENDAEVPEGLVQFLKYVRSEYERDSGDPADKFVHKLHEAVKNVKINRDMEERYMKLEELIKEEREEERIESEARGIVKSIFSLLLKLGELPDVIRVQIQGETNQEILLSYLNKAAASKTMDEFLKSIQQ